MSEVAELLVSWAVTTALSFAVVLADERWMSEARREQAWPAASRDAAIVAFGPLALPFHFARTRGRLFTTSVRLHLLFWVWFALGLAVAIGVAVVGSLAVDLLAMALGAGR